MKRLYLLAPLLILSVNSFAQPNFTFNDMPNIGDNDSLFHLPVYSPEENLDQYTGNDFVWDYSFLQFNDIFWAVDSFRVKTHPASAPFVDATIEYYHQEASGNNLELYSMSNDTLFIHRTGGSPGGSAFSPPVASVHFPIQFNQTSELVSPIYFGTSQIGERRTTLLYDGFGSIEMPGDLSYDNVFRIKSVVRDSTFLTGFSTVYTNYLWYLQGGDIPVMRIFKIDFNGNSGEIYNLYARKFSSPSTDIDENQKLKSYLYPNPSKDEVHFTSEIIGEEFLIYSLSGFEMMTGKVNEENKVNIQSLTPGVYFLKLRGGALYRFVKN